MIASTGRSRTIFDLFRGAAHGLIAAGLFLFTLGALGLWLAASHMLAGQQEKATMLSGIVIRPAAAAAFPARETVITLGRKQLLQNDVPLAAAERHIRIHRLANGGWKISNASANRQLLLEYADGAKYSASRQFVGAGLTAQISAQAERDLTLRVDPLSANSVRIQLEPRGAAPRTYKVEPGRTGPRLCLESAQSSVCEEYDGDWFKQTAEGARNMLAVGADRERLLIRFGGNVTTVRNRVVYIAVPGYPFDGLRLVSVPRRGFAFAPARDRTVRFSTGTSRNASWSFFEVAHDLAMTNDKARLKSFIAGRTRYALDLDTTQGNVGGLRITPVDGAHRSSLSEGPGIGGDLEPFEAPRQVYASVTTAPPTLDVWIQTWRRAFKPGAHGLYVMMVGLLAITLCYVVVAVCRSLNSPYRSRPSNADLMRAVLAGLAITAWLTADVVFALPKGSGSPVPPHPAIIAWAIASVSVFSAQGSGNHMRLIFAVATVIVAAGSYTMLALGLSSDELQWSRFYNETVGTIAAGAALIGLCNALPVELLGSVAHALARPGGRFRLLFMRGFRYPISLWLGIVFIIWFILAAAWVGLGSETGIPGLGQPSEAMKSLFIVLGSSVVTLMVRHRFGARLRPSEWQIFASVLGLIAVLLLQFLTPVISHDFSPFLILAITSLLSFFIIMLLHMCAAWASRSSSSVQMRTAPFETFSGGFAHELQRPGGRQRLVTKAVLWPWRNKYPLSALIGVPLILAGLMWGYLAVLKQPATAQAYLFDAPEFLRKPAKRLLSWIELDLIRPQALDLSQGGLPLVEFPDIGLQVMRSRESVRSAPCRIVPAGFKVDSWLAMVPHFAYSTFALARSPLPAVDRLLGKVCGGEIDDEPVGVSDLSLPEIQNDFVAAWVIQALGRDGAFALALLQFVLVCLMLAAAFRVMRWRSGDEDRRAASTFLAGVIVGFSVMLFLQFFIAWMNAFGLLPVMGQPMTFVSHGGSHFLLFGIPAILSVMVGLRTALSKTPEGFATLSPMPMRLQLRFRVRRKGVAAENARR